MPRSYDGRLLVSGYGLGSWVVNQRNRRDKLPVDLVSRLEALPDWSWNPFDARWEEGFAHLMKYVEREGHALVPDKYHEDSYPLGVWVRTQRESRRRAKLSPDRLLRLEELPGWTSLISTTRSNNHQNQTSPLSPSKVPG